MIARTLGGIAVVAMAAVGVAAQDGATVKVTVPHANIRSEASDRAPVVTQVPSGTLLQLLSIEGDWFHVRVPVGSIRIEAYISKRVSALASTPGAPASTPPAATPTPTPAPAGVVDGMSVAVDLSGTSTWVTPHPAKVSRDGQTWAWVVDGSAADRAFDDRRPSFVVVFKDVPGVSPDDLAPMLVRLTPAASGGRLVAAARGSADLASRAAADWDLSRDLKQDVVRSGSQLLERGAVKIRPAADLPAGDMPSFSGRARARGSWPARPCCHRAAKATPSRSRGTSRSNSAGKRLFEQRQALEPANAVRLDLIRGRLLVRRTTSVAPGPAAWNSIVTSDGVGKSAPLYHHVNDNRECGVTSRVSPSIR